MTDSGDSRQRPETQPASTAIAGPGSKPADSPSDKNAINNSAGQPGHAKTLTAEEQMALFEKELKENDWGHQPC